VGDWLDYAAVAPIYYNYGDNVVYQDNSVYVNGQDVGTAQQYYQQADDLASAGAQADASPDEQWLPLGVFSLVQSGQDLPTVTIQLAVNKQGILRGNYTDTVADQTFPIKGEVDKATQRAAWIVGDNKSTIMETGIYNLTKDEAPVMVHFGQDRTKQWLLVRQKQPAAANGEGQTGDADADTVADPGDGGESVDSSDANADGQATADGEGCPAPQSTSP
jgi:hypothetical protein